MFWDELSEADRVAIQSVGARKRYEMGTVIFHEGAEPSFALIILSGRIKLTTTSLDGRELLLELRGPGSLIGELGVVDDEPRSAAATALDTVNAIVINSAALRQVLADRGEVALQVLSVVTRRLRQSSQRRLEDGTSDVLARVCRRLAELAEEVADPTDTTAELTSALTQQELADWVGVSRDAIVMALRELRDAGWIETGRKRISIHNLQAVQQAAGL